MIAAVARCDAVCAFASNPVATAVVVGMVFAGAWWLVREIWEQR